MINLSEFGLKYNRSVMSIVLGLMIFGAISYFSLPAQEDPSIKVREAVITTAFPGMPAEQVELLISKTIEEGVRNVDEVREVRSVSVLGKSVVYVMLYERYFDLDQIWDKVRNELDKVANQLPDGTQTPFVNDNFGDVAVLTVALQAGSGTTMGELFDMAQHARDELYLVKGVQSVSILGAQQENIVIEVSDIKAAQLGISPATLIATMQSQNVIRPGGIIDIDGKSFNVLPSGNFNSLQELKDVVFPLADASQTIRLSDIANVYRDVVDPPQQTAYFNGKPAIVLAIAKNDRYSVTEVSPRVESKLQSLNTIMPAGVNFSTITRQADQVEAAVEGVSLSVIQTLAIVLAVVILFLGFRIGLIVGAIVPAVVLIVLAILNFSGMALERMSLATLIISLGLLVDNGIVVAEDFKKRLENGEKRKDIVKRIGGTLAIPLLTSSATTMLVFLPLMLAESASGEYTRSISIVIIYALTISWLLSLVVTPYLCYLFIKDGEHHGSAKKGEVKQKRVQQKIAAVFDTLNRSYGALLRLVLQQRTLFLGLMVAIFVLAGAGMGLVPIKFFPDSDRPQVLAYIDLPAGATMRETEQELANIFAIIDNKERYHAVENYAAYGGFGGPRFVLSLTPITPESNKAFIMLNLENRQYQNEVIRNLRHDLAMQVPNVQARVTKMFLGPSDSNKIDIQVIGPDKDVVFTAGQQVKDIMRSLEGTVEIKDDWENKISQVSVQIDQARAKRAGVTSADVARSLATFYSGVTISEYREGDDLLPIVVRGEKQDRVDFSRIYGINVYSQSQNVNVPLEQVANIEFVPQYARIAREDLFRTVTIEGKNLFLTAEDMVPMLQPQLDALAQRLPPSHRIEFDGVVKESKESQASLNANIPLCLAVVALILIAQFNSYRRAGIIILTVPLILIGAVIGLLVSGANFGFMVILGLYALAGIIVNNAIVLIDRIEIERNNANNTNDFDALINACIHRLRPIIMSTTTTILGLLPLIVSQDALFYGMSSAIAFGLGVGTVLTLGVVPVLYSVFFKIKQG
ncbi:MAG: efflux RND transporter permease subunit [Glaciecola sp.]